jgi:hypothetical protein
VRRIAGWTSIMAKRSFAGGAEPSVRPPSSTSPKIHVGLGSDYHISVEQILSLGNL